jgi:hypothetical protein
MKKKTMVVCGWCYASHKDVLPMKIMSGCHHRDRCAFCNRPVEFNAYIVEVGDEEDNERRPANIKRAVP